MLCRHISSEERSHIKGLLTLAAHVQDRVHPTRTLRLVVLPLVVLSPILLLLVKHRYGLVLVVLARSSEVVQSHEQVIYGH